MELNLDKLVIDRVVDGQFEDKNNKLLAVLDQVQNFSINTTSETKDKTDATGNIIKRFYTAKNVEVSGENAVLSLNLMSLQTGSDIVKNSDVVLPRILQVAKSDSALELPDTPIEGTLSVYGTYDNGLPNLDIQYVRGTAAGAGTYAISTVEGKTTIALPTDATASVQIKYDYQVAEGNVAVRVNQDGSSFPKECKATFRVLCSDVCDAETAMALYIVFPRFQMAPDFDWTVDTESAQSFSAQAFKDYCAKNQLLFYVAIAEDSDEYDAKVNKDVDLPEVDPQSPIADVTVAPESASAVLFGTPVSDMQDNVAVANGAITGTLKKLTSGDLVDAWGEGNFIALKFADLDENATSVKVGLDPSYGSGLVEIINDPDRNGAFKVTETTQKFVVETTTPDGSKRQEFSLSGLVLEA